MKRVLLSTGAALILALATVTTAASKDPGVGGGRAGGAAGAGGAVSHGSGGGFGAMGGGSSMRGGGPAVSGRFSAAMQGGNAGRFNGGNTMTFRDSWRMGRMDHDHNRFHRFREPRFAFGFAGNYNDYNDYYSNYDDDGCYQLREVRTRHGRRLLRVWVCD